MLQHLGEIWGLKMQIHIVSILLSLSLPILTLLDKAHRVLEFWGWEVYITLLSPSYLLCVITLAVLICRLPHISIDAWLTTNTDNTWALRSHFGVINGFVFLMFVCCVCWVYVLLVGFTYVNANNAVCLHKFKYKRYQHIIRILFHARYFLPCMIIMDTFLLGPLSSHIFYSVFIVVILWLIH